MDRSGKIGIKFVVILLLLGWMGTVQAGESSKGGVLIGPAEAAAQSQYALQIKLPEFVLNGVKLKQDRSQAKPEAFQDPGSRRCPPFCVEPEKVAGAVTMRLEDFPKMAAEIKAGKILIVDMRTPDWYQKGTLPGAINLPYTDLSGPQTKAVARMKKLEGKDIIAFCNGWWCGQSPTGIKALQELGYPGKIYYFRDGNQGWADAGLPFSVPQ
ncbi:MAG: rhodanese-like domain-containing protein [Magnetococcales bacterium]|nr:rhodanese-like domain-containing protein [Magnetococcales bacterium]